MRRSRVTRAIRVAFGLVLLNSAAAAQQYVISTIAGGAPPATPVRGLEMPLNVRGVATDAAGNVYFTSTLDCVFKLDPNGFVTLVAGNSRPGYSGDGGPGARAQLNSPLSMAVDRAGNVFIADTGNHRVRRVSPSGIIATVAGNGSVGFSGDGGPAKSSPLSPDGVAVDSAGNLFIVDSSSRVRKVSREGIITTVAGNGTSGFSGDSGPATSAQLEWPTAVAVDGAGNLFIADTRRVRKVSPDGIITSVSAGGVNYSFYPTDVAVDGAGNLFVAHNWSHIFKVSPDGTIATVAGNGIWAFTNGPYVLSGGPGDGGPATSAQLAWPTGVAVDSAGNLFLADPGRVRKVSPAGIITTVTGNGRPGFSGDGGPATSSLIGGASFGGPFSVAVDDAGNLFVADTYVGTDGSSSGNRVRKVSPTGIITTVAGNGTTYGFSGDGGPATSAQLSAPAAVVADRAGNLFIADSANNRIRKVSPDGIITTVAGNGSNGGSFGDGGPATSAQVSRPLGMAVDGAGNLFIGSSFGGWEGGFGYGLIRKVSASGIVTTVAGNGKGASRATAGRQPARN